jgi:hypothetical protein
MKTARQLKITESQHRGLQKVAELLDLEAVALNMGAPITAKGYEDADEDEVVADRLAGKPICGTVCCIGGWLAVVERNDGELPEAITVDDVQAARDLVLRGVDNHAGLWSLFYGTLDARVTPQMGAHAIRNFLETGSPDWGKVKGF